MTTKITKIIARAHAAPKIIIYVAHAAPKIIARAHAAPKIIIYVAHAAPKYVVI